MEIPANRAVCPPRAHVGYPEGESGRADRRIKRSRHLHAEQERHRYENWNFYNDDEQYESGIESKSRDEAFERGVFLAPKKLVRVPLIKYPRNTRVRKNSHCPCNHHRNKYKRVDGCRKRANRYGSRY